MLPCSGKPVSAIESDDRLIAAWTDHPHLRIIDNRYSFDEKMLALIREISSFLGEPRPMETKRKYLIARPDPAVLDSRPNCRHVEITQAYLHSEIPGETIRIPLFYRDPDYYSVRKNRLVVLTKKQSDVYYVYTV